MCFWAWELKEFKACAKTTSGYLLNGPGMLLLSPLAFFTGFLSGLKVAYNLINLLGGL